MYEHWRVLLRFAGRSILESVCRRVVCLRTVERVLFAGNAEAAAAVRGRKLAYRSGLVSPLCKAYRLPCQFQERVQSETSEYHIGYAGRARVRLAVRERGPFFEGGSLVMG